MALKRSDLIPALLQGVSTNDRLGIFVTAVGLATGLTEQFESKPKVGQSFDLPDIAGASVKTSADFGMRLSGIEHCKDTALHSAWGAAH